MSSDLGDALPTGGNPDNLRKTIRKHLVRMLKSGQVRLAGGRYYVMEGKESDLVGLVDQAYTKIKPQNWSYLGAEDSAICRTYVNPQTQHYDFDGFFGDQLSNFQRDIFYLDRILVDAIGRGFLSAKFYDPTSHKISLAHLRRGWNAHFKDTELLAWTFAISPSRLLRCLESVRGQVMLMDMLERNGEAILARGRKRLGETRLMQRKVREIQEKDDAQRKLKEIQAKTEAITKPPVHGVDTA